MEEGKSYGSDDMKTMVLEGVSVMVLDSAAGLQLSGAVPILPSPVAVREKSKSGALIGSASMYQDGVVLKADIFLDYNTATRLTIESGTPVYPLVAATVLDMADGVVKSFQVDALIISLNSNPRPEIEPLNAYVRGNS